MKTLRLLPCLLLLSQVVIGQNRHELKTDLVLPFFQATHLSYEFIPTDYLGIETSLWYRWNMEGNYYLPDNAIEPSRVAFPAKQQVLIATIAAKYYFIRPAPASGAFVGAYMREDLLTTNRDHTYRELYIDQYGGGSANNLNRQHNRQLRLAAGLLIGYKRILGQHWLLEACIGVDLCLVKKLYDDVAGIPMVRIGYRF